MKNRIIILTVALLFAMSLSAFAQGGILDRARQVLDAIDGGVSSGNQTQQPQQPTQQPTNTNTQSTNPQPTLDKLEFRTNGSTAYSVGAANNSISGPVVIPDTYNGRPVTFIRQGGFSGCAGITSIVIPASVTSSGSAAFNNCTNLTSVTFLGNQTSFGATGFAVTGYRSDLFEKYPAGGAGVYTRQVGSTVWTRTGNVQAPAPVNTSLDGVWEAPNGWQITINGSTAVNSKWGNFSGLSQDAVNKGYMTIGGQHLRNIRSTGNLTWSAEQFLIGYNTNTPNVANGQTSWGNTTITMNADGRTIEANGNTWTRR